MTPQTQSLDIQIEACVDSLDTLTDFMLNCRESLHIPDKCYRALELAADEAVTNVIQHGSLKDPNSCIKLSLTRQQDWITLIIEDQGIPFEAPESVPRPDPEQPLMDRQIGGLGLFIMEQMMDEVRRLRKNGTNRLVLKKKIR
jgi:serine/threonine-protein kinase RsbW